MTWRCSHLRVARFLAHHHALETVLAAGRPRPHVAATLFVHRHRISLALVARGRRRGGSSFAIAVLEKGERVESTWGGREREVHHEKLAHERNHTD